MARIFSFFCWVAHPLYGELGKILLGHEASPEFQGLG